MSLLLHAKSRRFGPGAARLRGLQGCSVISVVCCTLLAALADGAEPAENHPLAPLMEYARGRLEQIDRRIEDYTCTLVKRERIDGRLPRETFAQVKIRHGVFRDEGHRVFRGEGHGEVGDGEVGVPFSVYMRFLSPADARDREVVYAEGRHGGRLIVRKGGPSTPYMTLALHPQGNAAMRGNHYPLTEIGVKNLIGRLIEVGEEELQYDEIEVRYIRGAKVNQRECTLVQVTHPVRRSHFRYHLARIFIDDELKLPIRFASYDWPPRKGGRPPLIEEYTYLDLKLNVGLSDWDFDHRNENYKFRKDFKP